MIMMMLICLFIYVYIYKYSCMCLYTYLFIYTYDSCLHIHTYPCIERVKPMLLAQCPILLPRVLELIEKINHELLLVRLAQEAIERADEVSSCVCMYISIFIYI
jgi:hypothetical protein